MQNHNSGDYVILYYLLCAQGNFHFNQDTGSIAKWQRVICKEISVGSLLKHEFREWLGIAKGNILGEELFSQVGKKFWNMGERKEGEVKQIEKECLKNKIDSQIGCKWRKQMCSHG